MTADAGALPEGQPEELAEPVAAVPHWWTAVLALANLGLWVGYFGPLQVLLPEQVEAITPGGKAAALGLVTGLGALVAVLVSPVAGALSDRSTSRFGRRRPWALAGAVLGAGGLLLLAGRTSLVGVALGWCVAQAGLNTLQAALSAAVPDRVPVWQRATVSGWVSASQSLGVVVAVLLVTTVVAGVRAGFAFLAALVLLLALPFVRLSPDARSDRASRPTFSVDPFLRRFWISPRKHPDFAWAWLTRFLVQLGNATATLYLLYYLRDQVGYERLFPGRSAEDGLLVLIALYTAAAVLATVAGGRMSDRSGRRKRYVIASGLLTAVPGVALAFWPTWPVVVVSAPVLGLGFGVYMAVDQALVTQVLPAALDRGRDLGVINIANSAPQVLGPMLAALLVSGLGGYTTLYLAVAVVTAVGSMLVTKIRNVP
jgi:MFS family permease